MKCSECRFWGKNYFDNKDNLFPLATPWSRPCKRHAPVRGKEVFFDSFVGNQPEWPITHKDDWCGDFEQKPLTSDVKGE